jgi:hypothetical protein
MRAGRYRARRLPNGLGDMWSDIYDSFVTPSWLSNVQSEMQQLNALQPTVTDTDQSAVLNTLIQNGNTFVTDYQSGITVDNSEVANWGSLVSQFLSRIGQTAAGTANMAGQITGATAGGLFSGLAQSPVGIAMLLGGGLVGILLLKKVLE